MNDDDRATAAAFAEARKDALEHCAQCGALMPFTPPFGVPLAAVIYCSGECADAGRREAEQANYCPACGEYDPDAAHDDGSGGATCTPGWQEDDGGYDAGWREES